MVQMKVLCFFGEKIDQSDPIEITGLIIFMLTRRFLKDLTEKIVVGI